ncbi:MAG: sensor histidine kinase, partial [bacterium]
NKVVKCSENNTKLIGVHLELIKNFRNIEIGWMIILRDVTKNWQSDQMRSALTIASHEIKTPLNSILGSIDLLLEKDFGDLNSKQQHCLNIVKDDINRLDRLLTDILDLSRFDEGIQFLDRRKEIALGLMVNKCIESFKLFANSKNIQIKNKIPKSLPTFKGHRDRLQQVLANLVENSIKYTLPGGKVTIGAELIDSNLKFWVKDTGVGIPSTQIEFIFKKFNQLDNYPEDGKRGYGLGLSIAEEIIKAMGGEIWLESEVGVGSTFFVSLPL